MMKNQIRTQDLVTYFESRFLKYIELRDIEQAKFDAAEIEFNKSIWHKWFKAKYIRNCGFQEWSDLYYYRQWVRESRLILNQLEYRTKCGYETSFWEWENGDDIYGWKVSQFYNWCVENNIPC